MTIFTLAQILAIIKTYGYLCVLLISIPEGPIVGVLGGFLAEFGDLNIYLLFLALLLGDIVGDTLYYVLGKWSRSSTTARRIIAFLGVTNEHVTRLEKLFAAHDRTILLIGKLHPLGSLTLMAAGLVEMPFLRFIAYNILGTIPKVVFFEVIGYYFGYGYNSINSYLGYTGILIVVGTAVVFGGFWILRRKLGEKYRF
ncbi:MAG: DedA family protein [Minisyncoccia bacterium]